MGTEYLPKHLTSRFKLSEGWIIVLIILLLIGGFSASINPTAEDTLTSFCQAIAAGAYQAAFNLLAENVQNRQTAEQFANTMQQDNISKCAVSNVQENGTSATGVLTYVFANGRVATHIFHLSKQGRAWKIDDKALSSIFQQLNVS